MANSLGSSANDNIEFGYTRMNGTDLSGDTNYPNDLSIISQEQMVMYRRIAWPGSRFRPVAMGWKLGELLIYNQVLTDLETAKIETYLSKWIFG